MMVEHPPQIRWQTAFVTALLVVVCACSDHEARTKPPDAVLASFVTTDLGGTAIQILLENVIVYGNKGWRSGYYRLRSIDVKTGSPRALQLINHTRQNLRMACAPDREGIFWCQTNGGTTTIEMRSVDTLKVVQDFLTLQKHAPALADGIYKVLIDRSLGGLRITTGRGDNVILRGARPEVIPYLSGERRPQRFVPIGNVGAALQSSVETKAGKR